MKTEILYEDNNILVVYKPAGIATQTSKVGERDVVSELKNHLKGGYVGVIHRLDQPVEGVLVFAKNQATASVLSSQVQAKATDGDDAGFCKDYLAVVLGVPKEAKGRLENMMIKTPERTAKIVGSSDNIAGAKKAILGYELIETIKKDDYELSLLRIHLETGRFHQIRAQLSHIGCPIIGDKKYGSELSIRCAEKMMIRNVSLCADRLRFTVGDGKKSKITGKTYEYSHRPTGKLFSEFTSCNE